MLLIMGAVIGIEHGLVFALIKTNQSSGLILYARMIQYVLLVVLFLWHRGGKHSLRCRLAG